MKNKKGFEFSFGWLFAIIVGAAIIFLAIYATSRFIQTERTVQDTKLGKQLGIILSPIETSLEEGKITTISLPIETRIYNDCDEKGNFGSQKISTATKSAVGTEWQKPGFPSSFYNKYIFSEDVIEGNNFIVFSKPLEMPFKIADLIYIWQDTNSYCFVNPPNEIEEEILSLQPSNINITQNKCRNSINVCFNSPDPDCEIRISTEAKTVRREFQKTISYETTPLLYAAIFSTPEIYECQLKRLMKRASELSTLYQQKSFFLAQKSCSSNLELELSLFAEQTLSLNSSAQITNIFQNSETIRRKNNELSCKLF